MKSAIFVIPIILGLVIATIILLVVMPMMFGAAAKIFTLLGEELGFIKYSQIEQAIICYNLICSLDQSYKQDGKGCPTLAADFNDCVGFLKATRNFEAVCTLSQSFGLDPCEAPIFPIEIDLKSQEKISSENLKNKLGDKVFILTEDSDSLRSECFIPPFVHTIIGCILQDLITGETKWIRISKNHLSDMKYVEVKSGFKTYKVLESANVKPGKYYVVTSKEKSTVVFTISPVIKLETNSQKTGMKIKYGNPYRIEIVEEKEESCEKMSCYNYILKVEKPFLSGKYSFYFKDARSNKQQQDIDSLDDKKITFKTRTGFLELSNFNEADDLFELNIGYKKDLEDVIPDYTLSSNTPLVDRKLNFERKRTFTIRIQDESFVRNIDNIYNLSVEVIQDKAATDKFKFTFSKFGGGYEQEKTVTRIDDDINPNIFSFDTKEGKLYINITKIIEIYDPYKKFEITLNMSYQKS
ncbi:MAG: hypothetical protein N3D78_02445 [Candidatus Aenigmarchaeota archaeon]|nr:hypothetical protein [Candidatus Aenigmarchaeota archaeon]